MKAVTNVKTRKPPVYAVDFRRIKLESNIPIPEDGECLGRGTGRRKLYPLHELKVGESFSFPHDPSHESKQWTSIHSAIRTHQKLDPRSNFVVRIIRKEGVVRCWRVKNSGR